MGNIFNFDKSLKVFLEKHFISTVLSLVLSGIVFLITPKDHWIIQRITEIGYYFIIAGVIFLVIQLIIFVYRKVSNKNIIKKHDNERLEEGLENLWLYVDKLHESDKEILNNFINNGNKPYEVTGECYYSPESVLENEKLVHHRTIFRNSGPVHQYVMDKEFYAFLMYSKEKYGKICHFE